MRNVSDESFRENRNTFHVEYVEHLFSKNLIVYDIVWKNIAQPDRPQMTNITLHMQFACWKTSTTDTHSEYVVLIAFPHKQWLRESAAMLQNTYIACLLNIRKAMFQIPVELYVLPSGIISIQCVVFVFFIFSGFKQVYFKAHGRKDIGLLEFGMGILQMHSLQFCKLCQSSDSHITYTNLILQN